jgi:hypothetical protein
MTSTANTLDLGKENQDATKRGTGQATRGRRGLLTPDATPEPDVARNEADKARQTNASRGTEVGGGEFATTKDQPPDPADDDGETERSTGEETRGVQEVPKSSDDEHRKVLGVKESYDDPYEEEKAVLDALWDRGMENHPKFNKHKDAEKTFKSKFTISTSGFIWAILIS